MHPSSLLSYYPNYYILDEIVSKKNYKEVNIFIDLKNCLQTVYMEHAIKNIVENTKKSTFKDSSIFSSVLSFLSFHKIYSIKRNVKIRFYIFLESGQSYYHTNISKTYKISRRIDNLYGLDRIDRDLFYEVLNSNFGLIEKVFNRVPFVKVIRLMNLEADFVPYYLISRNLIPQNEESVNIIYSNDHDLLQCINERCLVFFKSAKNKKIVKQNEVVEQTFKCNNIVPDEYLPLMMAVVGDEGDDVKGIKGIGAKTFSKNFTELVSLTGKMDTLYDNIERKNPIFNVGNLNNMNKYMTSVIENEKLISDNLKLVSFELISRALDNPTNTEMVEKKKQIIKILENNEIVDYVLIEKVLERLGVYLLSDELNNLYFGFKK